MTFNRPKLANSLGFRFALVAVLTSSAVSLSACVRARTKPDLAQAERSRASALELRKPVARPKLNSELISEITAEIARLGDSLNDSSEPPGAPPAAPSVPLTAGEAKREIKEVQPTLASASVVPLGTPELPKLKTLNSLENSSMELSSPSETPLIFDIPVTYNERVKQWIRFFQKEGRSSFRIHLERSARFMPLIQYELTKAGLPLDLSYVAMIESGFSPNAVSHAGAMGLWQFIVPTGRRYNLRVDWWIDERKDFHKATLAAIRYMTDLYRQFGSWYLVAASYNMGEGGVRRLIDRHGTNNFWELADRGALPRETRDYVPKIIAAILISKAPALYGFRDLEYQMPLSFESMSVPGGTDIINLASYLGVSEKYLKELNPELIKGFVPRNVSGHRIRVPKGSMLTVSQYIRVQAKNSPNAGDGEAAAN